MLKLTSVRQSLCTAGYLAIMLSVTCCQAVLEDGRYYCVSRACSAYSHLCQCRCQWVWLWSSQVMQQKLTAGIKKSQIDPEAPTSDEHEPEHHIAWNSGPIRPEPAENHEAISSRTIKTKTQADSLLQSGAMP